MKCDTLMRQASFLIGLLLLVIGLFTGILGFMIFGIIGIIFIILGARESETETLQKKVLKEQLEDIEKKKLLEENKELKEKLAKTKSKKKHKK